MNNTKKVRIELGRRRLAPGEVGQLDSGTIVVLEAGVSDELDVCVEGRLHARGQAVVVNGCLGVRVSEVFGDRMEVLS
jgi:flagellar motor switch protein FliN/FliY